ncbi:chaperonin [Monoraphidium neglectum]|uniref:20 kDa chaperonin, chloroplastic n=1 Tax=Monoraphidium neglectum TaxID=145388 RepID=A0A0D2MPZ7_9CHLO|nr:chaperonin [Monoraphidium neglectum]KIZ04730.1 chaperonin [Monoraphidium neglectum]|eukprot:XP_013903749.1 chaperonin [Monoraphidium neglectum]
MKACLSDFKGVKPSGDRVLVKVDKEEGRTQGGVLLPTVAQNKPTAGAVVALGDVELVQSGDRVVYSKYAGTEVAISGDEHVLLKEDDVIGVLTSGDNIAKLKPLGDRVLIKCAQAEGKTAGGVLLTTESDKPTFGEVVAVGSGKKAEDGKVVAPNVPVGSTVMYSKYSGTEFEEGDDQFIVVRESDILAQLA